MQPAIHLMTIALENGQVRYVAYWESQRGWLNTKAYTTAKAARRAASKLAQG